MAGQQAAPQCAASTDSPGLREVRTQPAARQGVSSTHMRARVWGGTTAPALDHALAQAGLHGCHVLVAGAARSIGWGETGAAVGRVGTTRAAAPGLNMTPDTQRPPTQPPSALNPPVWLFALAVHHPPGRAGGNRGQHRHRVTPWHASSKAAAAHRCGTSSSAAAEAPALAVCSSPLPAAPGALTGSTWRALLPALGTPPPHGSAPPAGNAAQGWFSVGCPALPCPATEPRATCAAPTCVSRLRQTSGWEALAARQCSSVPTATPQRLAQVGAGEQGRGRWAAGASGGSGGGTAAARRSRSTKDLGGVQVCSAEASDRRRAPEAAFPLLGRHLCSPSERPHGYREGRRAGSLEIQRDGRVAGILQPAAAARRAAAAAPVPRHCQPVLASSALQGMRPRTRPRLYRTQGAWHRGRALGRQLVYTRRERREGGASSAAAALSLRLGGGRRRRCRCVGCCRSVVQQRLLRVEQHVGLAVAHRLLVGCGRGSGGGAAGGQRTVRRRSRQRRPGATKVADDPAARHCGPQQGSR